jgi:hypothetical protein
MPFSRAAGARGANTHFPSLKWGSLSKPQNEGHAGRLSKNGVAKRAARLHRQIEDQDGWYGKALKREDLEKALGELGKIDTSLRGEITQPG